MYKALSFMETHNSNKKKVTLRGTLNEFLGTAGGVASQVVLLRIVFAHVWSDNGGDNESMAGEESVKAPHRRVELEQFLVCIEILRFSVACQIAEIITIPFSM